MNNQILIQENVTCSNSVAIDKDFTFDDILGVRTVRLYT